MCGIIAYTGERPAGPILLDGLRHLEYRGYDSAGIALQVEGPGLHVERATGKIEGLVRRVEGRLPEATAGVGHTRWATHGEPSERNAHPLTDPERRVALVHNGIVENHEELRAELGDGATFASDTDTEVLAHLIGRELARGVDALEAVRVAVGRARGAFSLVAMPSDEPGRLIAARVGHAGGVVVGHGEGERLLASDLGALLPHTRCVTFLEPGELADVRADRVSYVDARGAALEKAAEEQAGDAVALVKGRHRHFLAKELHEQPDAVLDVLRGRYLSHPPRVEIEGFPLDGEGARGLSRVVLVGMGSSLVACAVGRHYVERFARLPAEVDNASEFRYRRPVLDPKTLVISVSQSGETADTLAAMEEARAAGCPQITLCNTPGAQATRVADGTVFLRAGPEISVASTKCLTTAITALHATALHLGRLTGRLPRELEAEQVRAALHLPAAVGEALELEAQVAGIAERYARYENFLFLGRGLSYPMAMEGALKLKELSYIHAEGYPAGEMKHGPIALVDESVPTVAIALRDEVFEKMRSNIAQLRARRGPVIAVVSHGDRSLEGAVEELVELPAVDPLLSPVVSAVPMQLLAYHIALERGADVDQPRNLAKTVTVE